MLSFYVLIKLLRKRADNISRYVNGQKRGSTLLLATSDPELAMRVNTFYCADTHTHAERKKQV